MDSSSVELGVLEKVPPWKLHHRYFPSKVGGFPAWLNLESLPTPKDLQCPTCGDPESFLLQMYAEEDASDPSGSSFHRTVYVFVCRRSSCVKPGLTRSIIVLRCGLPRKNEFYAESPPSEDPDAKDPELRNPICAFCGCLAPNTCSSCKKLFYCSRSHQILAWKTGHKQECSVIQSDPSVLRGGFTRNSTVTFAEYEIQSEPEEIGEAVPARSTAERNDDFKRVTASLKPELNGVPVEELEKYW